jgi:hypothetical protein
MPSRYYSAIAQDTTLSNSITNSSTSMIVGATVGYPSVPFILAVDYNAAAEELVTVTNISGTTLTITRGYNGTTPVSHSTGAAVRHVITAQDLTDAQNHYDLSLASGAHGATGALATFLGSPTSANLAATIVDETGSGSLVFGTSPTLATPTITSPSISSPSISSPTITGTINAGGTTGPSGQFLSSTGTGIAWAAVTPTSLNVGINAQSGTTYTLATGDVNYLVTANNASAITVTIPPSVFTTGQQVHVQQIGAGQVTFAAGSGVTITSTGGTVAAPKLRSQYSAATVICTGTNTFTVLGDIA